ncbi:MAG: hypothetical protein ACK46M_23670 [Planctomyces sp.]
MSGRAADGSPRVQSADVPALSVAGALQPEICPAGLFVSGVF